MISAPTWILFFLQPYPGNGTTIYLGRQIIFDPDLSFPFTFHMLIINKLYQYNL